MSKSPTELQNSPQFRARLPQDAPIVERPTRSMSANAVKQIFLMLLLATAALANDDSRGPTSDEAVSGTWDGTAGSRYTLVDDHPDAAGSDYLTHGTTAGNLTFGFPAFTIAGENTVASVQVIYYDQRTGGATSNAAGRLKVGASYFNASTHAPANGTWTLESDTWTQNPATSAAWTVDQVNGSGANALAAFGFFSTDANPTVRFSSVIVRVNFTGPAKSAPRRVYITQRKEP